MMEDEKAEHYKELLGSLVDMIEQRDAYTAGHTQRVASYCEMIAEDMGVEKTARQQLYEAAVLHDIGKLVVPDAILLKPGRLNKGEFELIKQHLTAGYDILHKIKYYQPLAEIIRYHHEKYDGTGYFGYKGNTIPIISHILIVADAIDAMTSNRIYQARKTMQEALQEVNDLKGRWYDPEVADAACRALQNYTEENKEEKSQVPITLIEKARFSYYYKDQLTGVYNETYLKMMLEGFTPEGNFGGFIMIRTLGMHKFNTKHGWHMGDELLKSISNQLTQYVSSEHVFRVMGDDFILGCKDNESCITIMSKLDFKLDTEKNIKIDVSMVSKEMILNFIE